MIPSRHAPVLLAALLATGPVTASATTTATAPAATKQVAQAVLPFIENDLPRALAEAKSRNLPLFIESWAPW